MLQADEGPPRSEVLMALFAVTTAKGSNWRHDRGIRDQDGWEDHAQFFDGLVEQGVIVLGGPIDSHDEEDVALLAVQATDEIELRSIFRADPWAASGVLRVKDVRAWTIWLDSRESRT
jgi:uncharacterized protein YciI